MATPLPHYRLALGDYRGQHSWLVQSKQGVGWRNVPPDLESILEAAGSGDVLDFDLGGGGRWYIKYNVNGTTKRKLSKGLWSEIGQDPNHPIERLYLGNPSCFWALVRPSNWLSTVNNAGDSFFCEEFNELLHRPRGPEGIRFVAFGYDGCFCVAHDGDCFWGYGAHWAYLKNVIERNQRGIKRIANIVLSPLDPDLYVVFRPDGSYDAKLPDFILNHIAPYLSPSNSMRNISSTPLKQLRRLERNEINFDEVGRMFIDGWLHPHKRDPRIEAIYTVEMPDYIDRRYRQYRARLERMGNRPLGNERLKFHGTPRICSLGDHPHRMDPCNNLQCSLCRVIKGSFSLQKAGTAPGRNFLRFGRGIYTTSVSSKADDYNGNSNDSGLKAVLVAKVALGLCDVLYRTRQYLTSPPNSGESVQGEVGCDLNYDEQVVYCDEAIRPAYLIIYRP